MPVARQSPAPLGVVYTPPDVARAMADVALAPLLVDKSAIAALRVCDPAVGDGALLAAVIDVLAEHIGDALTMQWRESFDLVIGNPPYIRQELLADATKSALREYACYDGVADLYVYFLELAHRIGRRYCFITPNKWLTVAYAEPLRRFLAKHASVEGVVDLGSARVFDEDAFPCIVWGNTSRATPLRAARIESRDDLAHALHAAPEHDRARWQSEPWHIDAPADRKLLDELARRWPRFDEVVDGKPSRGIVTGCNRAFEIDRATADRLLAAHPDATDLVRPLVKGRDIRRWNATSTDRFILLIDHGTELDRYPAIVEHLARFREQLEPKPARGDGPGRKPGTYRWYELQDPVGELTKSRAPRLFFQDIQTSPACCLDENGLVPDTTVWAIPSCDRYLLAVLNSPLYHWYAQRRFPPALNGAVRPKLPYLRALPIATPSAGTRAKIEQLVDRARAGEDVEAAIADAVHDAYELSRADRTLIAP